ncbi:MAG: putative DNA-binding domain-containing protein [Nitrospiraceae bacterium]
MPTLLDVQAAVRRSIVDRDDTGAAAFILAGDFSPTERLNIYRGTFVGSLTTALRLTYPAVHKLVGVPFFESAAAYYIDEHPPAGAYLNEYGGAFAAFLSRFAPAASLPYLPDVARLEWAISRAIHAEDVAPLDIRRLASIRDEDQDRIRFIPHPSVSVVNSPYPVDAVWQAVLEADEAAMTGIDLGEGPVWLLVQRIDDSPRITRMSEEAWYFAAELLAKQPLHEALHVCTTTHATALLAEHLAAGRFADFHMCGGPAPPPTPGDNL